MRLNASSEEAGGLACFDAGPWRKMMWKVSSWLAQDGAVQQGAHSPKMQHRAGLSGRLVPMGELTGGRGGSTAAVRFAGRRAWENCAGRGRNDASYAAVSCPMSRCARR